MFGTTKNELINELENIKSSGLYKSERIITSKQGAEINTTAQNNLLNFCANNYLVLASDKRVVEAVMFF